MASSATSTEVLLEAPTPRRALLLSLSNSAPTTPSLLGCIGSYLRGLLLLRLARGLVSKRKRRFLDAGTGLDLDLSYISDRLVATGYPSSGLEALYRNPAQHLRRLLAARHGLAACRVWNLCIERGYAADVLLGCSARQVLTWYDHTPPPLAYLRPLCEDIQCWLDRGGGNVAVVRALFAAAAARCTCQMHLLAPPLQSHARLATAPHSAPPQTARRERAARAPSWLPPWCTRRAATLQRLPWTTLATRARTITRASRCPRRRAT